jgi:hypothetical protein
MDITSIAIISTTAQMVGVLFLGGLLKKGYILIKSQNNSKFVKDKGQNRFACLF